MKKHETTIAATADREYKNNIFCMLFEDKENVLSLYNAINQSSHTDPAELEIVTLKNAIFMNIKNDLAFVIDTRLNLYEHQSTYNPNMPLRDLYYIVDEYRMLVGDQSLYSSTQVRLPAPRFLVFYNGNQRRPEKEEFKLSNLYETKETDPQLELKVTVLNINSGNNKPLLQNCSILNEYMQYVNCVRQHLTDNTPITEAVSHAVDECIQKGILRDFLLKNKAEAINMSIYEYNEAEEMEKLRRQEFRGGYDKGRIAGREELLSSIIQKKMQKGLSIEEIAELLEEDIDVIRRIQTELINQNLNQ